MEDDIKEKIKIYCEKGNMKMDSFSIRTTKDGYIATDKYTSIMFDRNGKVSSLPMHMLYGKRTNQLIGKGYALGIYIAIAIIFAVIVFVSLIK